MSEIALDHTTKFKKYIGKFRLYKKVDPFWIAVAIMVLILAVAFLAPLVFDLDPYAINLRNRLIPPGSPGFQLGSDQLGRDILVRLIYGARISLTIGLGVILISGFFGTVIGMISGFVGGVVDNIIMRIAEVQMTFPFVVLALVIMALFPANLVTMMIVFSIAGWPLFAKISRGSTLVIREANFVEASQALGGSLPHIIFRHILPNILPYILVLSTLQLPIIIFNEAGLSFLGVGLNPPEPSWGVMLGEGREYVSTAWWLAAFPGFAMMITVMTLNFIGDGLSNRLGKSK